MLLIAAAFAGPAVIDPAAAPLVAKARAAIGDPYQTDGVRFTFVVGDTRRTHAWDVKHDRIAVSWTRDDGVTCAVTTTTGYAGDDKTQREAWEIFVNDQFWLFAPAKLADDGATVTTAGDTLTVRYDGVGVTPGDQYTYTLDPQGVVTAWTFVLASGRSGTSRSRAPPPRARSASRTCRWSRSRWGRRAWTARSRRRSRRRHLVGRPSGAGAGEDRRRRPARSAPAARRAPNERQRSASQSAARRACIGRPSAT